MSLPTVAALLMFAVYSDNLLAAVIAITLCYGLVELNEGAYWAATIQVAGANTITAAGILHTWQRWGG